MKLGFIGLGKMGSRMVLKLLQGGHEVVVWTRSESTISNFQFLISNAEYNKNFTAVKTIQELVASLRAKTKQSSLRHPEFFDRHSELDSESQTQMPKQVRHDNVVIWLMLPAGDATQTILDEVSKEVEEGDIIIDGGNSYYKDTQKRFEKFQQKGIKFLGIGVSGGIIAADTGYPMMVGGDYNAYCYIAPLLNSLAKPEGGPARHATQGVAGGYEYFGEGGAGHFVKMIHNGIEYGIMQSLAEGFAVLEKSPYKFDLLKIAKLYQKGTLVSGFILDRTVEVLEKDPHLENITGVIATSGEADWTVSQAKEEGIEVPIIEASLVYRKQSQTDQKIQHSFTAKMVAALRHAFGGHPIRPAQGKEVKKQENNC